MSLFINGVGQDSFNMNGVSIDNLYVDDVLVWTSIQEVAGIPRYELTEALVDASTVNDSANTLDTYNGLLTESDGITPYEPTAIQYPENGLLELANGRRLNTSFPVNSNDDSYGLYGIYDADGTTAYKIWALDLKTNDDADLYEGDQDTPLSLTGTVQVVLLGDHIVRDGRPSFLPPIEYPEIVPNPDFTNNIDGVTEPGLATATWQSPGYWRTTRVSGERNTEYILTDLLEIGVEYIADMTLGGFNNGFASGFITDTLDSKIGTDIISESAYVDPVIFTATETTIKFVSRAGSSDGSYIDIDAISLKRNI